MVSVVRLDAVKGLGLDGRPLPDGVGEGRHPVDAGGDIPPLVAGHLQGHGLGLDEGEGAGGEDAVGKLEAAHVEHSQVEQL